MKRIVLSFIAILASLYFTSCITAMIINETRKNTKFENKKESDLKKFFGYDGVPIETEGEYDKAIFFSTGYTVVHMEKKDTTFYKKKGSPVLVGATEDFNQVKRFNAVDVSRLQEMFDKTPIGGTFYTYLIHRGGYSTANQGFGREGEHRGGGEFVPIDYYEIYQHDVYEDSETKTSSEPIYAYTDSYTYPSSEYYAPPNLMNTRLDVIGYSRAMELEQSYLVKGYSKRLETVTGRSLIAYIKDGIVVKVDEFENYVAGQSGRKVSVLSNESKSNSMIKNCKNDLIETKSFNADVFNSGDIDRMAREVIRLAQIKAGTDFEEYTGRSMGYSGEMSSAIRLKNNYILGVIRYNVNRLYHYQGD